MYSALFSLLLSSAHADETTAESCLKNKVWESYGTGWALRTMATATLPQAEYKVYLVTLYAGTEYRITACGDAELANADVVLYDSLGNLVLRDMSEDREPSLSYTPSSTDTFYISVHATRLNNALGKGTIAMALTYK